MRALLLVVALSTALAACRIDGASPAAAARADRPVDTLAAFVRAAGRGDVPRMWALLSRSSQTRFGSLARFRNRGATDFEEGLGSFARGSFHTVLSGPIGARWAVAAIAGQRRVEGSSEYAAYAAALHREAGAWRLQVAGQIELLPLRPVDGKTVSSPTQLAVEVRSPNALDNLGIWLDGRAVPGKSGGSPQRLTAFTQPLGVAPGRHTVVVFASAGKGAAAVAWTFRTPAG
jgi:hypothetical protein